MINLLSHLIPLVKSGKKTATTRYGDKTGVYQVGTDFVCDVMTKEQISVNITEVKLINFSDIDSTLAQRENYSDVELFKNRLQELYGTLEPDSLMTVVYFEIR